MKAMPMPQQAKKSLVLLIYFALAVSTLLVFWQVRNFDFVNFDDDVYAYENPYVLNGLTADGIVWAFTSDYTGNWHPLTWLSLMLNCQLFGSNPAGFHLTNLFFHIANTLLLFFVLKQMTKAIWQSAFVAALFALHPLHVESVAWVSERKDVLSTFFWLLTMWAYVRYVKNPKLKWYLISLVLFALGLMAKPMLVTLPFVLLLLDYWPLDRISRFQWKILYRLILEKIPFLILAAVFSVIAFISQRNGGTLSEFTEFSLKFRTYNALISYLKYIGKAFYPVHLAVFYPHPFENVSVLYAVISAAVLLAVTILVILCAPNRRYLITGWFWFVVTLIPVIGIVQVGSQAYADRYTYVPYIGLFLMLAWLLSQRKIILGLSMVTILTTLGICAHRQAGYWNNSFTLFYHAIEVTQNNYVAYNNLGAAFAGLDRFSEAIDAHTRAIKINPNFAEAFHNLGNDYGKLGRSAEAIEAYEQAIKINPNYAQVFIDLGIALDKLNRGIEAIEAYKQSIKINPSSARAYFNLGVAFDRLSRTSDAIDAYRQAVKIKPDYAKAYCNLGNVYSKLARFTDAIKAYQQAISIKPDYVEAQYNLGIVYLAIGDKNSALAEYNILKSLNPQSADNLLKEINK
jgi:protein O-mannosyl-transferase